MDNFNNKVAVITGAASGIGQSIAIQCIQEKMNVVLADIDKQGLDTLEQRLQNDTTKVISVVTDVCQQQHLENLLEKTISVFGAVHILFNNAGVGIPGRKRLWEHTTQDWLWTFNVNIWGVIYGIKTFVPYMLQQNIPSHIVNTASSSGLLSPPKGGAYTASKHAVVAVSEVLYQELHECNAPIGVSVICPGFVNTQIYKAERNRPKELANISSSNIQTSKADEERRTKYFANAMSPQKIAQKIFHGIRQNKFYILTHPEYKKAVERRLLDIIQEINPTKDSHAVNEDDHSKSDSEN